MITILVVGPSGSGKDTLLRGARQHFNDQASLLFARRYITRPPGTDEDNFYLSEEGFEVLMQAGFFISHWQAHGYRYGVARHDVTDSRRLATIVSVSRSSIATFEAGLENVATILIDAAPDILRKRLLSRKRETEEQISRRLLRARQPVKANHLIRFDNSVSLADTLPSFILLIDQLLSKQPRAKHLALFSGKSGK